jgi:hypothetical protein
MVTIATNNAGIPIPMPTPRAIRSAIDRPGPDAWGSSWLIVGCVTAVDVADVEVEVGRLFISVCEVVVIGLLDPPAQVNAVEAIALPVAKNRHLPTLPVLMEGSTIDGLPQLSWSEMERIGVPPSAQDGRVIAAMEDDSFVDRQTLMSNGIGEPVWTVQSLSE